MKVTNYNVNEYYRIQPLMALKILWAPKNNKRNLTLVNAAKADRRISL